MDTRQVNEILKPQRDILLQHPLYKKITKIEHLHTFVEGHVYAVWDFMSLLKALQSKLTCVSTPWFASELPNVRYLINCIVLAEESDTTLDGKHLSHFEMYLNSMKACGADIQPISQFITDIQTIHNNDIFKAIDAAPIHPNIKNFLQFTFQTIANGKTHEIAAAFTFGREDLIPSMFTSILNEFKVSFPDTDLTELIYYFQRHIELDADDHGPMAYEMVTALCGNDESKWNDVIEISRRALEHRILLWDAIEENASKI